MSYNFWKAIPDGGGRFSGQDAIQSAEQIAKAKIAPISLEEKFKERNQTKIIPTFILHQNITGIGKAVS
ncbi:MAG: hypothetical protein WA631_10840 [Nitrososphaeraceae archaeon]